jgi:pyruvate dehydrogenase E1 component
MPLEALRRFRDRFELPISDEEVEKVPFLKFEDGSPERNYLRDQRLRLGGYLPARRRKAEALEIPPLSTFARLLKGTEEGREISTTMAFVQMLTMLCRDKKIGKHIVPIVPDESRTFGMEGLFRQLGIWSQLGQLYTPEDADQLMFYREDKNGQILQEGINEAGALCDWIAAATAYSTHGVQMIPFFIYYSMFGFQRTGDLNWAAGDMRARGFLLGGTAGRTTLNGEGLQHEDGHSHIVSATIPNCISYDPTFSYEVVTIIRDGMRRMYEDQEDVYYYVTLVNENYPHPPMPEGAEEGILRGMYRLADGTAKAGTEKTGTEKTGTEKGGTAKKAPRVQLLGSGTILREVIAAGGLLRTDWGVESDVWSCPSFTELARDGNEAARYNMLDPAGERKVPWVQRCLEGTEGPVIAATDYIRLFAEQIRAYVPRRYVVLGTDGFGRSDTREKLRRYFEVDRYHVAVAALNALADEGAVDRAKIAQAVTRYGIDAGRPAPWKH